MIIFLFGEDNFRSRQKLNEIKCNFQAKNAGISEIEADDFEFGKFSRELLTGQLFSEEKLIIIYDILSIKNSKRVEKIIKSLSNIPVGTTIIFYESSAPDKRSKLFKSLDKSKNAQEFKKLIGYDLQKWIKNEVSIRLLEKAQKYQATLEKIFVNYNNDLWKISNDLEKISLYLNSGEGINQEELKMLASAKKEDNIFAFLDYLAQKNTQKSFEFLYDLKNETNQLYLLSMMVYQFRNLLIIKDTLKNNKHEARSSTSSDRPEFIEGRNSKHETNSNFQISKQSGLNPYVVQKIIPQVKNFDIKELKNIYQSLFDYDTKIKSGKIDADLALDMLVFEICEK